MIVKRLEFKEYMNDWRDKTIQEINDPDTGETVFYGCDLYDCPEDCTLERDLVSAHEVIEYINYGIRLGKQGYEKAELAKEEK